MLSYLCVPVKDPMALCGDIQGIIISRTNPDSELKKNHMTISYQKVRESSAAGTVTPIKVCTTVNQAKILMNSVLAENLGIFSDT